MFPIKSGVISVRGVAGGRKTQMVADLALTHPDKRFLYLSYGRANAEAVKKRFPRNVNVHTYHSYIYYHFTRLHNVINVVDKITPEDLNIQYTAMNGNEYSVLDDMRYAPYVAAVLNHFSINRGPIGASRKALDPYKESLDPEACDVIMKSAAVYLKYALKNHAPVTHEMYLKLGMRDDLSDHSYEVIISDEHQDTSRSMQSILMNLSSSGHPCVIKLGDPLQQIFQHLGAELDHDLITPDYQFDKTFRCGKRICELANQTSMPHYQQLGMTPMTPASHDGEITLYDDKVQANMERGAILHFYNASVIEHAISLVEQGHQVKIDSPSLRKGLFVYRHIIDKSQRSKIGFHRELDIILRKAFTNDDREILIAARVISNMSDNLSKLESALSTIATQPSQADFLIATIHYCKGQTFNHVMLGRDTTGLNPENRYHANLIYTAITRAAKHLYVPRALFDKINIFSK